MRDSTEWLATRERYGSDTLRKWNRKPTNARERKLRAVRPNRITRRSQNVLRLSEIVGLVFEGPEEGRTNGATLFCLWRSGSIASEAARVPSD